jgi:hypothetical protein
LTSWMSAHGWCNSSSSCCNCQWLLHINGNQPNKPFVYYERKLAQEEHDELNA